MVNYLCNCGAITCLPQVVSHVRYATITVELT